MLTETSKFEAQHLKAHLSPEGLEAERISTPRDSCFWWTLGRREERDRDIRARSERARISIGISSEDRVVHDVEDPVNFQTLAQDNCRLVAETNVRARLRVSINPITPGRLRIDAGLWGVLLRERRKKARAPPPILSREGVEIKVVEEV